jgi:hypothetical protein
LQRALDGAAYADTDAPEYYNLKCMRLDRDVGCQSMFQT